MKIDATLTESAGPPGATRLRGVIRSPVILPALLSPVHSVLMQCLDGLTCHLATGYWLLVGPKRNHFTTPGHHALNPGLPSQPLKYCIYAVMHHIQALEQQLAPNRAKQTPTSPTNTPK